MMSFLKRAETGQYRAAMPCHSRGMAWHSSATTPATGHFGASGPLKNTGSQGAATPNLTRYQFCKLNQCFALICSLLRYVWTFYEARRAELNVARPGQQGGLSQSPPTERRKAPQFSSEAQKPPTALPALLAALLAPVSASAGAWPSSGSFCPEETTEVRKTWPLLWLPPKSAGTSPRGKVSGLLSMPLNAYGRETSPLPRPVVGMEPDGSISDLGRRISRSAGVDTSPCAGGFFWLVERAPMRGHTEQDCTNCASLDKAPKIIRPSEHRLIKLKSAFNNSPSRRGWS